MGRRSIDPSVFFTLHLIMFFEGIRSERQLMETVNVNLAHRWYIGYDLHEPVPDHSSLRNIRTRYGLPVFVHFFEKIVELCIKAGLVWGKERSCDGTRVGANAAVDSMVPRWYWTAKQHIDALFHHDQGPEYEPVPDGTQADQELRALQPASAITPSSIPGLLGMVEKYDGTRLNERRTPRYQRWTDTSVSPTDPDAAPMSRFPGDKATLGYHTHSVVDGGKARIILAALVTLASVMDNTPMLDLVRWVRFRWKITPRIAVGDTRYGTVQNSAGVEQDGITAYLPTADFRPHKEFYGPERFTYDADRNLYRCPQGQELPFYGRRQREAVDAYRADAERCNTCPVKAQCTERQTGRYLFRSFFQAIIDRVKAYAASTTSNPKVNPGKAKASAAALR
jgi:hypothetical protein